MSGEPSPRKCLESDSPDADPSSRSFNFGKSVGPFLFLKEIAEDGVNIHVEGTCMSPHLDDGSLVQVANSGPLLPGDILVYRSDDGRLVVHRLLGCYRLRGEWMFLLQADSAARPDRAVRREQVLGRIVDRKVRIRERFRALSRYFHWALLRGRHSLHPGRGAGESA